jgi:hypothetical protein
MPRLNGEPRTAQIIGLTSNNTKMDREHSAKGQREEKGGAGQFKEGDSEERV